MQPPERQPIGFWTQRAAEAIRARTRGALEGIGMTQPEWWIVQQISRHPDGVARSTIVDVIGHNDTPEVAAAAVDTAAEKGWVVTTGGLLALTPSGAEQLARAAALQEALDRERRQGVTAEDHVTTIVVLQKTIANVGGDAWHW